MSVRTHSLLVLNDILFLLTPISNEAFSIIQNQLGLDFLANFVKRCVADGEYKNL